MLKYASRAIDLATRFTDQDFTTPFLADLARAALARARAGPLVRSADVLRHTRRVADQDGGPRVLVVTTFELDAHVYEGSVIFGHARDGNLHFLLSEDFRAADGDLVLGQALFAGPVAGVAQVADHAALDHRVKRCDTERDTLIA